jgi:hypothetical protein
VAALCNGLEHLIASCVTKAVVHQLEMVDVQQQKRSGPLMTLIPGYRILQIRQEASAS